MTATIPTSEEDTVTAYIPTAEDLLALPRSEGKTGALLDAETGEILVWTEADTSTGAHRAWVMRWRTGYRRHDGGKIIERRLVRP